MISLEWNKDIAYIVGLIASDGCLQRDGRHVVFTSADLELVEKYRDTLGVSNKITKVSKRVQNRRPYFYINTAQVEWYSFLYNSGLHPGKSFTLREINLPGHLFLHFFRGLYDGDGTFYSFRDIRYPRATVYYLEYASASKFFVEWLLAKLRELLGVKGMIKRGKGVYIIRFFKSDSRKIIAGMYENSSGLFLNRKYAKIMNILSSDPVKK